MNTNLFNYSEERVEALACHNIALWYQLCVEQESAERAEQQRRDYYHNKFLDDDMDRCLGGF